jgi:hypothetical protein
MLMTNPISRFIKMSLNNIQLQITRETLTKTPMQANLHIEW